MLPLKTGEELSGLCSMTWSSDLDLQMDYDKVKSGDQERRRELLRLSNGNIKLLRICRTPTLLNKK